MTFSRSRVNWELSDWLREINSLLYRQAIVVLLELVLSIYFRTGSAHRYLQDIHQYHGLDHEISQGKDIYNTHPFAF